ncbi:hypothetical protein BDQ17DRAFT_1336620 [Cyathus striatus]|nr:hypothetical protein BDQ17DRAFT_1336620 [Cyathus striatus]
MTKHSWATPNQCKWLKARIPGFLEAKEAGKTGMMTAWFTKLYNDYLLEWGMLKPSRLEKNEWGSSAKTEKWRKQCKLSRWFRNHTCTTTSAIQGLLDLKPNKGFKVGKSHFEVENTLVKFLYEKEDEEVRKEVEETHVMRCQGSSEFDSKAETDEDRNICYDILIDKISATVGAALSQLAEYTGWKFSVLSGGPQPHHGGKMETIFVHYGKDSNGDNWESWMGKKNYTEITNKFDDFLHACFCDIHSVTPTSEGQAEGGEGERGEVIEPKDPNQTLGRSKKTNDDRNECSDGVSNGDGLECTARQTAVGNKGASVEGSSVVVQNNTARHEIPNSAGGITSVTSGDDITSRPDYACQYHEYLWTVSSDSHLKALVSEWKAFELKMPDIIPFPTKNHPKEVAWWIKKHRSMKAVPPVTAAEFGISWMAWWSSIQPQWHISELQCAPDGSVTQLWDAVEDVTWVFHQVGPLPVFTGAKRGSDNTADSVKPKKW